MTLRRSSNTHGLSLVELIVVLCIVVVLIGILIPATTAVRRAARLTQCASNLRQIGQAIHSYRADHRVWPNATAMPAPFAMASIGDPTSAPLPRILSGYLPQDNGVYRCPGDLDQVFERCAAAPWGLGISYCYWTAYHLPKPNDVMMNDYQGNSAMGMVGMFHPPRYGMNQLLTDGSVEFGYATPAEQ